MKLTDAASAWMRGDGWSQGVEEGGSLAKAGRGGRSQRAHVLEVRRRATAAKVEAGLLDRLLGARSVPHRTPADRVAAIAALRRFRLSAAPGSRAASAMALLTVAAVSTRIGLGNSRASSRRSRAHRYERVPRASCCTSTSRSSARSGGAAIASTGQRQSNGHRRARRRGARSAGAPRLRRRRDPAGLRRARSRGEKADHCRGSCAARLAHRRAPACSVAARHVPSERAPASAPPATPLDLPRRSCSPPARPARLPAPHVNGHAERHARRRLLAAPGLRRRRRHRRRTHSERSGAALDLQIATERRAPCSRKPRMRVAYRRAEGEPGWVPRARRDGPRSARRTGSTVTIPRSTPSPSTAITRPRRPRPSWPSSDSSGSSRRTRRPLSPSSRAITDATGRLRRTPAHAVHRLR